MSVFLYAFASKLNVVFIWLCGPLSRVIKRVTRGLWEGELKRLERNIDERDNELERTRRWSLEAQQSTELLQRRVNTLSARVDKAEYDRILGENRELQSLLDMAEADAAQRTVNFERALARATKKQCDLEELLEARSKELQQAQTYVTKLDEVAESEVVSIVELLNGQIFQAAASLCDAPEFRFGDPAKDAAVAAEAKSRLAVSPYAGLKLLELLGDSQNEEHFGFVQLALQAGLAKYAEEVAHRWDPSASKDTKTLESVYESMRSREPQSVAGRWRALGRSHLKRLSSADHVPFLVSQLSVIVTDILLVAGATGTRDAIEGIVSTEFASDLREIVTLALDFHYTVGERVVSKDFTLLAVQLGEPFDATRMQAANPEVAVQHACVLGTTQLGLVAERSVERDKKGRVFDIRRVALLKCTVVLQDTSERAQEQSGAEDSTAEIVLGHSDTSPPQVL